MKNNHFYKILASGAGILIMPSEDGQVPHEFTNNAKDGMQFDYRTVDEMETGKRSTAYGDASACQAANQPEPSATTDSMKWYEGLARETLACTGTWLLKIIIEKTFLLIMEKAIQSSQNQKVDK